MLLFLKENMDIPTARNASVILSLSKDMVLKVPGQATLLKQQFTLDTVPFECLRDRFVDVPSFAAETVSVIFLTV